MKRFVSSNEDSIKEYKVSVNFAGFVGAEKIYTVYAESDEEAEKLAVKEAKDDLEVDSIEQTEDGYDVTLTFAEFIGVEETFSVEAKDEDEAELLALDEAESSLTAELADEDEETEEDY